MSSFEYVEEDQPQDPEIESLFVAATVAKVTSDGCIQLETPDFVLKRRLVRVPTPERSLGRLLHDWPRTTFYTVLALIVGGAFLFDLLRR